MPTLHDDYAEQIYHAQADAHEKAYQESRTPEEQWGPEVAVMVEKRRKEAQEWLDAVM